MISRLAMLTLALALCAGGRAHAQTDWTLPSAYPANNFHVENLALFAKDVAAATGGKLRSRSIPTPRCSPRRRSSGSCRSASRKLGEVLISLHENDDAMFGLDVIPFLATSFEQSAQAVDGVAAGDREAIRRATAQGAVRRAVAAAGHLRQEADQYHRRT